MNTPLVPSTSLPKKEEVLFLFSDDSGDIQAESKVVVEPLVFERFGRTVYRYVGALDPPKPKPIPEYKPPKPKGFHL